MSDQLRVGEAIIDLLTREYGVDTVFGIPGVHNIELYRGLHRSGVRAISPRHEQGAGFMADGWSVVTGKPGVCVLISGPGLTNALTPIAQAYHDSRPMLVLASTTPTSALGKKFGPLHDLDDQSAVVRTVTAFSETVTDPTKLSAVPPDPYADRFIKFMRDTVFTFDKKEYKLDLNAMSKEIEDKINAEKQKIAELNDKRKMVMAELNKLKPAEMEAK